MCGEKMMKAGSNCAMLGLPPRMRGKAVQSRSNDFDNGITPAYAGKSSYCCWQPFQSQDHPRVCGEKAQTAQQTETRIGSPPRMRGKGAGFALVPLILRITPAYAGKSAFWYWYAPFR